MLKNYLITALRSLVRNRFFSLLNITGLAVGMAICMGIIMLVADQFTYDRHNVLGDRIFRINTLNVNDDGIVTDSKMNAASPMPLRGELMENYTGIEKVVRLKRGFGNGWIELENQNVNIPLAGFYADPEVLEVFGYELQHGEAATALQEPYSVVLTRKAADKLFKNENPTGQTIAMGELGIFTVTGVLKETPHKSHIVFEALASMATVKDEEVMSDWTTYWEGWTYALMMPDQPVDVLQQHLDKIYQQHIGTITNPGIRKMKFTTQSILKITPSAITNNSIGPVFPWVILYFLGGLALVILLTSCFNFTNLSIARSITRSREIGVRKVTGASRFQIFIQFLSESMVVALVALVFAVVLLLLLKPMVLQLNFARIFRWDLASGPVVYAIFFAFALVVGIIAGFFPAVVLSAFRPVTVLKGAANLKLFSRMGLRKALITSQFTLSLFFILSVIVIHSQLSLFLSKDHGFNMDSNIFVRLNNTSSQQLKNELMKYPNITGVAAASHVPAAASSHSGRFKKQLDDLEWITFGTFRVDEDYLSNMQVELVAGNFFRPEAAETNRQSIVINENAVTAFNLGSVHDALGQQLISYSDSSKRTIIGVVKDYNHHDLTRDISPMALLYNPDAFSLVQVAYDGSYEQAVASIEAAWTAVNPDLKIDYKEVGTEIRQYYEIVFGDLAKVLGVLAFLAILISCLGLLGMATYTTESRLREISIRKVLGSSGMELVVLLSKGFVMTLVMAIAMGVPAAWFINNLWLELIAYHTSLNLGMIGLGVLVLLLFGVLTIGSQTIRATYVKPVDNLRGE
jgi:putative ABC transport system permease protein